MKFLCGLKLKKSLCTIKLLEKKYTNMHLDYSLNKYPKTKLNLYKNLSRE